MCLILQASGKLTWKFLKSDLKIFAIKSRKKITYLIHVHEHQDLFTKLVIIKTEIC